MAARLYKLELPFGLEPYLYNPRPAIPYRNLALGGMGWGLGPEVYSPRVDMDLFSVTDIDKAVEDLEEFAWRNKSFFVVYAIHGSKIGATALRNPSPPGFAPKLFMKRKPD